MKRKIDKWNFETVGNASENIEGQRKLAIAMIEAAIELGLLPDNRREVDTKEFSFNKIA